GDGPQGAGLGDGGEVAGEFVGDGDVVVGDVPAAGGGQADGEDDRDRGVGAGQPGLERGEQEADGHGGVQGAHLVAGVDVEAAAEQGGQREGELDAGDGGDRRLHRALDAAGQPARLGGRVCWLRRRCRGGGGLLGGDGGEDAFGGVGSPGRLHTDQPGDLFGVGEPVAAASAGAQVGVELVGGHAGGFAVEAGGQGQARLVATERGGGGPAPGVAAGGRGSSPAPPRGAGRGGGVAGAGGR